MTRYQPEIRYAESGGTMIAFSVSGTGPVDLVLVPGFVSHLELQWQNPDYRRYARALARGHRLIQLDKRGTGLSDPATALPTLGNRVDDMLAVMAAARSRRAVVLAASEGVRAAIALAAEHPDRILGLVLYGSSYRSPPHTARMRALESVLRHWGEGRIIDVFAPSKASPQARRAAGVFERAAASPAMARAIVESLGLTDVTDLMAGLAVPTLVLHREGDIIPVREARLVASKIPGAELVVLPGRDHLPWVGDWAALVAQVNAFAARVAPARVPVPSRVPAAGRAAAPGLAAAASAALGPPRSAARPVLGWASLTEAEHAVVSLVAEGLSNRAVADALFLSRYTVQTHLKHVFAKLAVESRTELASLAVSRTAGNT